MPADHPSGTSTIAAQVAAAARGEAAGGAGDWARLDSRLRPSLQAYAAGRGLRGDAVEDFCQEMFLRLVRYLGNFRRQPEQKGAFRAYWRAIAPGVVGAVIHQSQAFGAGNPSAEEAADIDDHFAGIASAEFLEFIDRRIAVAASPQEQAVWNLTREDDRPVGDLAAALGVSYAAAANARRRLLQRIRSTPGIRVAGGIEGGTDEPVPG